MTEAQLATVMNTAIGPIGRLDATASTPPSRNSSVSEVDSSVSSSTAANGGSNSERSRPSAELALIQQQQNQREIDRLRQQLEAQNNDTPQRGMPTGAAPRRGNAFDARSIQRSVNLARDTAIRINGGLSEYRPGKCMFRGSDRNPCITQSGPQGILFQIPGGPPGWEETTAQPSTITILLIAPDGRAVLQTISNGALQTQQPNPNNYPYPAKNYPKF